MKTSTFLFIFLNCLCLRGQTDQLTLDYNQIKSTLLDKKYLKIQSEYVMYADHTTNVQLSTASGYTIFSNGIYNQSIEGITTIIDGAAVINFDPDDELIVVDQFEGDILSKIWSFDLEQLSNFIVGVERNETETEVTYSLQIEYSTINKLVMTFFKENYHLSKMVLYYSQEDSYGEDIADTSTPRLEVYTNYNLGIGKVYSAQDNPYVITTGKEVRLKHPYTNYTLINNLIEQ